MIMVRDPDSIYTAQGDIENGSFSGRWHFSFEPYYDSNFMQFGNLRVFNDDTLSPGAVWPLHPHRNIEVVTYCAQGEFRHEDEHGKGGVLQKGWVQHTSVGSGMWHSEINNREDLPMRFIQMWFLPSQANLRPSVEQKQINKADRTNRFLLLVSNSNKGALKIFSDVQVYSCFLEKDRKLRHTIDEKRGGYLYVVEGGPAIVNDKIIAYLGAAEIMNESELIFSARDGAELLFVDTVV